jgi:hypothetical protein
MDFVLLLNDINDLSVMGILYQLRADAFANYDKETGEKYKAYCGYLHPSTVLFDVYRRTPYQ